MKKIDGIYRQVKRIETALANPKNRKRIISLGSIVGLILGLLIVALINWQSVPKETQARLQVAGDSIHFNQKVEPIFVLNTTGIVKSSVNRKGKGELDWGHNKIKAEIFQKAVPKDFAPEITAIEEEKFEIKLNQSQFTAGKYDLKVTITTKNEEKIFDQDFTWGVLAINTNKSIFLPGDKAYLQMAALKDDGHTICDGDLSLEVINPKGEVEKFATKDETIQESGTCLATSVTNTPDYFTYYQTTVTGTYQLKLTNLANNYEITDTFNVQDTVAFDVERTGPTRIYPPADYTMNLNITANQDYQGQVLDFVPSSFELKTEGLNTTKVDPDLTKITWEVNWQKGQSYKIDYIFNAPDISPQFYLLGPLKIGSFAETRRWQIAADAVKTSNGTGGGTWATGSTWVGGVAPVAGVDSVIIASGDTVNIGTSTTIVGVQINANGILTHTSNKTLGMSGNYVNNGTHTNGTAAFTLSGAGATIDGGGSEGGTGAFTTSTAKTILNTCNLTLSNTWAISAAVTMTNNGAIHGAALTGSASGSTWTNASGSTLEMSGAVLATGTLTPAAAANTVIYNGAAQTIKAPTTNPYWHLSLTGSGTDVLPAGVTATSGNFTVSGTVTTSLAANLAVSGNFTLSGTQLTIGAYTTSVTGTSTISGGTLVISSTTGTKTFTGGVTISGSAVWNNSGGEAVTFQNGLTNNSSGSHTWGAGVYTFDTNDQNIGGTNAISIPSVTSGTAAKTLTNTGTLTITTALAGNGNFTNGASATLNLNFTGAMGLSGTFTATASGNTVSYGFAGAQTVQPVSYVNLILTSSGAKTMTNVTTISGDLTISSTATMTSNAAFTLSGTLHYDSSGNTTLAAAIDISIGALSQTAGTITDNGRTITVTGTGTTTWTETGTFTATGTVIFTGSSPEIGTTNFNNLTITVGTSAKITGALDVNGNFSVTTGNFDCNSQNQNFAGNFSLSLGTTYTKGGTLTFDKAGSQAISDSTAGVQDLGTVTIGPATTTTVTVSTNARITNLTIGADDTLDITGKTFYVGGNFTNSNTLTATSSTVDFTGSGTQSLNSGGVGAGHLFNNLTHSGSGTLQLSTNNLDVDGNFNNANASGTFDANNLDMATAGNWSNSGTFTSGTGTVTFDGSGAQSVTAGGTDTNHDFYNLIVANGSASGVTFTDSLTVTTGTFTDTTAPSKLTFTDGATYSFANININGSGSGDVTMTVIGSGHGHWHFIVPGTPTVTYVTVDHSDATGSGAQIDATSNCHDGNNNTYWNFVSNVPPNSPTSPTQKTSPGGVSITESAWTIDNTPDLGFTISDNDAGDTVKYQVQVDGTSSGFTNLVLDYTYSTLSPNPTTFAYTVGQSGGTYAIGSQGMTLSDSATGYWWRVKAIDNGGLSSSYVEFGVAGTMDLKVDATAPTGGTVTDSANTGSLTQLEATLSGFDATVSGLYKYEYAIGTTAGGTNVRGWTDNSPLTSTTITATSLNLQTSVTYYFTVRATDNATNVGTAVNSAGQMVLPTLSFTLGSTSITFDNLNAGNSYHPPTKNHTLGVTTNAANGYTIYGYTTQVLTSLQYPSKYIDNYAGTWTTPTTWTGYGFGYTSSDTDVQGSNRFGGGTKYCGFVQTPPGDIPEKNIVADNTGSTAGDSWTITYQVATTNVQEASTYQTTAIYIVVPSF